MIKIPKKLYYDISKETITNFYPIKTRKNCYIQNYCVVQILELLMEEIERKNDEIRDIINERDECYTLRKRNDYE
jgi:predicted MPP superfamily phosphohydrolase